MTVTLRERRIRSRESSRLAVEKLSRKNYCSYYQVGKIWLDPINSGFIAPLETKAIVGHCSMPFKAYVIKIYSFKDKRESDYIFCLIDLEFNYDIYPNFQVISLTIATRGSEMYRLDLFIPVHKYVLAWEKDSIEA